MSDKCLESCQMSYTKDPTGLCPAGLSVATLNENSRLRDFFKVTALSTDRDGLEYIANMEARDYPITATQWHPVRPVPPIKVHMGYCL